MATGTRVAEERVRQGLSQQELATKVTKLGYKISQTGIDKIEKRDTERPKCLKELAAALGVSEQWLLSGTGNKQPSADAEVQEIVKEIRQLSVAEQESVLAQFRALLGVALAKDRNKIK